MKDLLSIRLLKLLFPLLSITLIGCTDGFESSNLDQSLLSDGVDILKAPPAVNAGLDQNHTDGMTNGKTIQLNASVNAHEKIFEYRWILNNEILLQSSTDDILTRSIQLPLGNHVLILEAEDIKGRVRADSLAISISMTAVPPTPTIMPPMPTPTPMPLPTPTPEPAPPVGKTNYPFYMPMDNLISEPQFYFEISCSLSNAAGELRTKNNESVFMSNSPVFTGVVFEYEAPCVYTNMAPGGIRNWYWADGAQVIHRTSQRGVKAVFKTNNQWHRLSIRPGGDNSIGAKLDAQGNRTGQFGGRFHTEIIDIEFDNSSESAQAMGSLHFEVYPKADSGVLATLVVRDSKFSGGKNALFAPSGAVMIFAENSEFSKPRGNNVNQEHAIYINGVLSTHFVNTKIYGDRASGPYGGHQLKNKGGILILEDVTLSNDNGHYDPSNMPLLDGASQAYVWSTNLKLHRVQPDSPRDALVDLRRTAYPSDRLAWPFPTAAGADMGVAAPGCLAIKPEYNEYYMQVFKDTVVDSAVSEKSIFRQSGFLDTILGSSDGATTYEEVIANPQRNRAWLFTFNTDHNASMVTEDAYFYNKPSVPTYHCENPNLPSGLNSLLSDRDQFITHALGKFEQANPKMYKILD